MDLNVFIPDSKFIKIQRLLLLNKLFKYALTILICLIIILKKHIIAKNI